VLLIAIGATITAIFEQYMSNGNRCGRLKGRSAGRGGRVGSRLGRGAVVMVCGGHDTAGG
jgi:hypothetical protein